MSVSTMPLVPVGQNVNKEWHLVWNEKAMILIDHNVKILGSYLRKDAHVAIDFFDLMDTEITLPFQGKEFKFEKSASASVQLWKLLAKGFAKDSSYCLQHTKAAWFMIATGAISGGLLLIVVLSLCLVFF